VVGLIPLEVFNVFGGRRWDLDGRDVEPFMRYLARCAPRLREVGLYRVWESAVLPLRRTISTVLTGLDLRHVAGLNDLTLATLLRSRTGRRLRSLSVVHTPFSAVLREPRAYAALSVCPRAPTASDQMDLVDGAAAPEGAYSDEFADDTDAHDSTRGASGLRLRRAHIDVGELDDHGPVPDVTDLWMLGPRAVLGPYSVPRPF
jgi:hypothetical protein